MAAQKLDPYINVDPGTMSPYQHGEVFVTEDGAETDLDLGHYERFIDEDLNKYSNLTTGKVYWNVLNKERRGEYLGETVQVIPAYHQRDQEALSTPCGKKTDADVVITEIGGTTGDIECQPFLEAIRQVSHRGRAGKLPVYPCDAGAVSARLSGEHKIKAHPAFRQGAAEHGHHAGYHRRPLRRAAGGSHPAKDRTVLQRQAGLRHRKPDPAHAVRGPADAGEKRTLSDIVCRELASELPPAAT